MPYCWGCVVGYVRRDVVTAEESLHMDPEERESGDGGGERRYNATLSQFDTSEIYKYLKTGKRVHLVISEGCSTSTGQVPWVLQCLEWT